MAKAKPDHIRRVLADRARDPLFGLSGGLPRLMELDLDRIQANPDQPRQTIDEGGIEDLAASIERHGLLQPILVREEADGYVLVAGQRRLMAHRRLGRGAIPALLTTGRADELALIENLQREDLSPLEEAEALAMLKERHGYNQEELGRVVGKAKSTISELLSLNDLPAAVKERVRAGELKVAKSVLVEMARADGKLLAALLAAADPAAATTVRSARAARKGRAGEPATPEAASTAGKRLLQSLEPLSASTLAADEALRQLLRQLHRRIGVLLDD
jgi:ParB family chromosome partitioning protein